MTENPNGTEISEVRLVLTRGRRRKVGWLRVDIRLDEPAVYVKGNRLLKENIEARIIDLLIEAGELKELVPKCPVCGEDMIRGHIPHVEDEGKDRVWICIEDGESKPRTVD